MPETGQILGHYRLEQKLGEGAFGQVWRAVDIRLERKVALKLMHTSVDEQAEAWGRLLEEARAASALNHPAICATFDIGEEDGLGYIAMEYVEGRPLSALLSAGPLSPALALTYGIDMAAALDHAHNRGIVHRDIKASNVMIMPDGHTKLLDFGLARRLDAPTIESLSRSRQSMAELGGTAGTLCYMAPELLRGKPASPRSDLWSFGALLYEMLSGKLPFQGNTPFELSVAIMVESPAPLAPEVPEQVRKVVRKCLEKDAAARPADAGEVQTELETAVRALQTTRGDAAKRTRSILAAIVGLAALAACTLGLGLAWRHYRITHRPAPATITVVDAPAPQSQTPRQAASVATAAPRRSGNDAGATLKPAGSAQKAHMHAPQDGNPNTDVWVNLKTRVYHCPGTRWYKKTANGRLIKQRQAQLAGYHAASDKPCE
jgi:serine/threonine protein kinase